MTAARTDATRWLGRAVAVLGLAACAAAPAHAAAAGTAPGRWVELSLQGGSTQPTAALADYQWDVRPHAAWGARSLVGRGAWSGGIRYWSSSTTQSLGIPGTPDPHVRTTSVDLVGRARVARWGGVECMALATGGRLALRYQPDRLTLDTGSGPVEVTFAPVWTWVAGAGVGLRAPLTHGWTVGMEAERRTFAFDTAHRSGPAVTYARETFGDWHARFELGRTWGW